MAGSWRRKWSGFSLKLRCSTSPAIPATPSSTTACSTPDCGSWPSPFPRPPLLPRSERFWTQTARVTRAQEANRKTRDWGPNVSIQLISPPQYRDWGQGDSLPDGCQTRKLSSCAPLIDGELESVRSSLPNAKFQKSKIDCLRIIRIPRGLIEIDSQHFRSQ